MTHIKKMLPLTKAQMKKINGGAVTGCRPLVFLAVPHGVAPEKFVP